MKYLLRKILFILPLFVFVLPVLAEGVNSTTTTESSPAAVVFGLMMMCFMFCLFALVPVLLVLSLGSLIWAIIDVLRRDFGNDENQRVLWILIIFFVGFPFGVVLYYFMVAKKYPLK